MKERQQTDPRESLLKEKKPIGLSALKEKFGLSDKDLRGIVGELVQEGYGAGIEGDTFYRTSSRLEPENHDHTKLHKGKIVRFGLISDTHLSSKKQRLDALEAMYDIFEREGITHIYHAGDLSEGQNIYRGQETEVLHFGQEEQIDYAIRAYPKRKGMKTHWIGGNHDLRMYERGGVDPGPQIERGRPDMPYLGQYSTRVTLKEGVTMDLLHPNGAPAYARSYKGQRFVNNMPAEGRPQIFALGHWHMHNWCKYQGVQTLLVPAFKAPGAFEKRLGFGSDIGGYVIELSVEQGKIDRFKPELFSFNKE